MLAFVNWILFFHPNSRSIVKPLFYLGINDLSVLWDFRFNYFSNSLMLCIRTFFSLQSLEFGTQMIKLDGFAVMKIFDFSRMFILQQTIAKAKISDEKTASLKCQLWCQWNEIVIWFNTHTHTKVASSVGLKSSLILSECFLQRVHQIKIEFDLGHPFEKHQNIYFFQFQTCNFFFLKSWKLQTLKEYLCCGYANLRGEKNVNLFHIKTHSCSTTSPKKLYIFSCTFSSWRKITELF